MVFKNLCVLVLWMIVALALEGARCIVKLASCGDVQLAGNAVSH